MSERTISIVSSAQLAVETRSYFFAFTQPATTAPEVSCRSPRTTESEMVITATLTTTDSRSCKTASSPPSPESAYRESQSPAPNLQRQTQEARRPSRSESPASDPS